jgi:hypothetical protein
LDENRKKLPFSILRKVERLPPFWLFSQSKVFRRKPNNIKEVMESVESVIEQEPLKLRTYHGKIRISKYGRVLSFLIQ